MVPWIIEHYLAFLVLSPLVGIVLLLIIPKQHDEASFEVAIFSTGLTLFLAVLGLGFFSPEGRFAYEIAYEWWGPLGLTCRLGVDGLGILFAFLVSLTIFIVTLLSWRRLREGRKEAFVSILLFEMALIGFFASTDVMMTYILMEVSVLSLGFSLLFLTGADRGALSQYVGYMSLSSLLLLIVVIVLSMGAGSTSLVMVEKVILKGETANWILGILFFVVLQRAGLFPCHGWVRAFERKLGGSGLILVGNIFLAAIFLFYRFLPVLVIPAQVWQPVLSWIVVSSIIISAFLALSESDLFGLILSVVMVHVGFALLGIVSMTSQGFAGAGTQMVALSLTISLAAVLLRLLKSDYQARVFDWAPGARVGFMLLVLALAVLPGLSHFPGLYMIWIGLFKGSWVLALASLFSIILIAAALIRMAGSAMERPDDVDDRRNAYPIRDSLVVLPFIVMILVIGIFPDVVLNVVRQSTEVVWRLFY